MQEVIITVRCDGERKRLFDSLDDCAGGCSGKGDVGVVVDGLVGVKLVDKEIQTVVLSGILVRFRWVWVIVCC